MTLACGGEELAIEAQAVVCDERGVLCPTGELAQNLLRGWSMPHILVADAGVARDEGGDALAWAGVAEEAVLTAQAARLEAHGRNLDELIGVRMQARGFQVVDHKRIPGVEAV